MSSVLLKPALTAMAPVWLLLLGGAVALSVDVFGKRRGSFRLPLAVLAVTVFLSLFFLFRYIGRSPGFYLQGSMVIDGAFFIACLIVLLTLGFTVISSTLRFDLRGGMPAGEFCALVAWSAAGMLIMSGAENFITLFLGLELMSIPLYVLCVSRGSVESVEGAFKYFILGAFSSALLVFGAAFIYGASGSIGFREIYSAFSAGAVQKDLFYIGLVFVLAGFLFKAAAVPFHMWAPDAYQGAPSDVTGFMAAGVKVAAFTVLFRVFAAAFSPFSGTWAPMVAVVSVATMTLGNLAALAQRNVKRMLAYSSIAHAGYLLIAIAVNSGLQPTAVSAVAMYYYLLAYAVMTVGAFGIVYLFDEKKPQGAELEDFAGFSRTRPVVALCMAVFMFSLAGFPPTAGFFAKFYLFKTAVDSGAVWLVAIAVINSLISVYYYLRVVYFMYMKSPVSDLPEDGMFLSAGRLVAVGAVLGLGLFPAGWLQFLNVLVLRML